jgi:PadR family transcriptional regulator, regulatory protein AphA
VQAERRLSTTSYAILGLLSSGPHTAYEIAQQMQRSFDYIWPRARSGLYTEPKALVAARYATVSHESRGRRPRAVYAITRKGQRALSDWLDSTPSPPTIEIETILRVMFADRGTKAQLQSSLHALRDYATELQARLIAQGESYPREGPLAHRMHLVATGGRFLHEYADLLQRYAQWAISEIDRWPSTGPDAANRGPVILEEQLVLFT